MKAVILGGGIAGLTMGYCSKNWMLLSARASMVNQGHAFWWVLMGFQFYLSFRKNKALLLHKQKNVNLFSLKKPTAMKNRIKLDGWHCMKRWSHFTLIFFFFKKQFNNGRVFSHFYMKTMSRLRVFENGETEYGDIFIGADGSNSKVRESLFGKVNSSSSTHDCRDF
jgi:hypothetical protein